MLNEDIGFDCSSIVYAHSSKLLNSAAAAAHCNVQPTYFSNVMKLRADFNDDQIFLLCEYLDLDVGESEYLKLCHQWTRSGLKHRKESLINKITALREKALSPAERFKVKKISGFQSEDEVVYFLDPMHQVLAMCLNISPERKNLDRVRAALHLSDFRLQTLIENLSRSRRIRVENNKFVKAPINSHLGADSKVLLQHQAQLRQLSVECMRQLDRKDFKAFSVTFSGSAKDKAAIEEVLTQALEQIRSINEGSREKEDQVFQLNLDFFSWFGQS